MRGAAFSAPAVSLVMMLFLYASPLDGGSCFTEMVVCAPLERERIELLEELELDVLHEFEAEL